MMQVALLLMLVGQYVQCQDLHQQQIDYQLTDGSDVYAAEYPSSPGKPRSLFCPPLLDIYPCICYEDENAYLNLECKDANITNQQFETIFTVNFPISSIRNLNIEDVFGLTRIDNVFGNLTFESVNITNTLVATISDYAFSGSVDTLTHINISKSRITTEGFPFLTLQLYNKLVSLSIVNSSINFVPNLQSASLTDLILTDNVIPRIESGVLQHLQRLKVLDVSRNQLTNLAPDTIRLYEESIMMFNMSNNSITNIQPGAFTIATSSLYYSQLHFNFDNNNLTEIREDVFGDLFSYVYSFTITNNPLSCLCDMAWIITEPTYMYKITNTSTCVDGTHLHDLESNFYQLNC